MRTVYLDNAATSPLRPEASRVLTESAAGAFPGNPSGSHTLARRSKYALEEAREQIASLLGARPAEVIVTSGGTEADNLAIGGALSRRGGIPVCGATEHHAVLRTVEALGGRVAPVQTDGRLDPGALDGLLEELGERTTVVSVMAANNETGVANDIAAIARRVRQRAPGAYLHCDAVQAVPWLDTAPILACCDLASFSAHKFGGPPGIGFLVARDGVEIAPLFRGGGQERDLRPGTPNVAAVVAAAAALAAAVGARDQGRALVALLRDRFLSAVLDAGAGFLDTSAGAPRLPTIAHLTCPGTESEELLLLLDEAGICASAGASCASGALEPSHVLDAMGVPADRARSALRFSFGWANDEEDVDRAAEVLLEARARLGSGVRNSGAVATGVGR